ncbi:proton pump-interactor BIP131 isoform X1 [Gossypium raimondii]|uniref:proton pump-interactor BIP131 isoform X1 n=1 Tax=Gossypium raimondii TaxID=29730 RepID=UPI00227C5E42|nr:proton pump-interactor BIP131 isoform X1 [Gossypium raimondii]
MRRSLRKISLELRIEQHEVKSTIEGLEKELIPMKEEVFVYYDQRREMLKQKEAAQYCISKLRQTFVEMNGMYDEYVSLLSNAKELARNKDVAALWKLSHQQVEEFMSEWNHPYVKTFRTNYKFSILPSLSDRWLSRDGRIGFGDDD